MTNTMNQNPTCKAVCWLIGISAGSYLAVVLVNDFARDQIQSAVLGIVTMLLVGLVLRRALCRQRGSRVQQRVAEANARAAASRAVAPMATPAIKPAPKSLATTENYHEDMVAKPAKATLKPVSPEVVRPKRIEQPAPRVVTEPSAPKVASAIEAPEKPNSAVLMPPLKTTAAETVVPGKDINAVTARKKIASAESKPITPAQQKPVSLKVVKPLEPKTPELPKAPKPKVAATTATVKPAKSPQAVSPSMPKGLEAPENGVPDDLQKIDGIGESEQQALFGAGIFHYAQFVTMNRRELAWLDQNIGMNQGAEASFEWRKQAIALTRKAGKM